MRRACVVLTWTAWAALGIGTVGAAEPAETSDPAEGTAPVANVIARGVRAISADVDVDTKDGAALLVLVVDDAGDPLDAVPIVVLDDAKEIGRAQSDSRGRALLRLPAAEQAIVRVAESGLVPSEAHDVELRKGGLTAVVLSLEDVAAEPAR
jgi:hypothetical protein